jgi:hypothetical protein
MKHTVLIALITLSFGVSKLWGQEVWSTTFEDDLVKIEYRLADCEDIKNDLSFSYYLLRIQNKSRKKVNVRFAQGEQRNDENLKNLIVAPLEVLRGECTTPNSNLRIFAKDNRDNQRVAKKPFQISKITTYAL